MLYRQYRDNVVLPNVDYINTHSKTAKYPINLIFKGK